MGDKVLSDLNATQRAAYLAIIQAPPRSRVTWPWWAALLLVYTGGFLACERALALRYPTPRVPVEILHQGGD